MLARASANEPASCQPTSSPGALFRLFNDLGVTRGGSCSRQPPTAATAWYAAGSLSKEEHIDWFDNRLSTWPVAMAAHSVEATGQFFFSQSREHRIAAR